MRGNFSRLVLFLLAGLGFASGLFAQNAQVERGEVFATCFSGLSPVPNSNPVVNPDAFVAAIVDVRDPANTGGAIGNQWPAPMFHNEFQPNLTQRWTARNLGQVFGITFDDATPPNIYLSATTTYGLFRSGAAFQLGMFGPGGTGGEIYRLNGQTGAISLFKRLPNSGQGLGDVVFDRRSRQLYVSNFEDGLIYRLVTTGSAAGTVLSTYDHGLVGRPAAGLAPLADNQTTMPATYSSATRFTTASGFTPLGRRPWAVQVFEGRLYYSVWGQDSGRQTSPERNQIWSVALTGAGDFVANSTLLEITVPPLVSVGATFSNPVADIAFSPDGRMLVAERTMRADVGPDLVVSAGDGHRGRVLEFPGESPANWGSPLLFQVGRPSTFAKDLFNVAIHANSEGGADYGPDLFPTPSDEGDCSGTVWSSTEQILNPPLLYGLQGTRAEGNSAGNPGAATFNVDLNGILTTQDKSRIGDVEAFTRCDRACLELLEVETECLTDGSGDVLVRFRVRNNTPDQGHHLFLVDLPTGVSATPNQLSFQNEPGGFLAPGATSGVYTVRFHGATPGALLAFRVTLHNANLSECCALDVAVPIPECDCLQILEDGISCAVVNNQPVYTYQYAAQSLVDPQKVAYLLFVADTPGVTVNQSNATLTPPLMYGQTKSGAITFFGPGAVPGGEVCLLISAHDRKFQQCCAIERCVRLPLVCGGCGGDPSNC